MDDEDGAVLKVARGGLFEEVTLHLSRVECERSQGPHQI